jgi:hypothetical protein
MRADCWVGGKLCERKKVIKYWTSGTKEQGEKGKRKEKKKKKGNADHPVMLSRNRLP